MEYRPPSTGNVFSSAKHSEKEGGPASSKLLTMVISVAAKYFTAYRQYGLRSMLSKMYMVSLRAIFCSQRFLIVSAKQQSEQG